TDYAIPGNAIVDGDKVNVPNAALILPVNRTVAASGAVTYTPSPTGTSVVVITAKAAAASGDYNATLFLNDPNFKPLDASASGPIPINLTSNPTLLAAIYNYTGTLVGVRGAGFAAP
ncbi:MAG: hypothetical protein ACAI44_22215, partial [Candidatus Sericytochromatia bacterium]